MTTKTHEQGEWELQCYGCSEAVLRHQLDEDIVAKLTGNYNMVIASLLSDAQQEIEFGLDETARQTLNKAKFILFNYVMKEKE